MKLLKNWKAGRFGDLRKELLLKVGDSVYGVQTLVVFLNKMWEDEALPDDVAVGRIVTFFKGGARA